jgi:hypothetical protein
MPGNPSESQAVQLSVAIYRGLVRAYPRDFRRDFGEAMVQVFRDACRRASQDGDSLALLSFWGRTLWDYIKSVIEENVKGGTSMTREKFYKLSGWALMLSPFLFVLGFWAASRPEYSPFNAASLPVDRYANTAGAPIAVIGILFSCLGLLGLLLRYTPGWNGARILLALSVVAGLASAVGAVLLDVVDGSWYIFILGLLLQYLFLGIFGILSLRQRPFPRWNGLPLLAFWLPIGMLLSIGFIPTPISNNLVASLWVLSIVMFAGLGYLLQETARQAVSAVAG